MKILKRREFGDGILRETAKLLPINEIKSRNIQTLIKDMRYTLSKLSLGIGLAAPQIGQSISLSVISIRSTPHRPTVEKYDLVIINPVITKLVGRKSQMWEGCISGGPGKSGLFAKVPRYKSLKLKYTDEKGINHHKNFDGLLAHVIQHEIDHLAGVLFVDKVKDTKSYMSYKEYIKFAKNEQKNQLK